MATTKSKLKKRIETGEIIEQKCWQYIKELNSVSDERLDSVALIDCKRSYTYRQMFRRWERYAEVFSALNMTGEHHARVGLLSEVSANSIFALYALNMTGASVSMFPFADLTDQERCANLIKTERITDLVLCDTKLTPEVLGRLARSREELGLRSIVVMHVSLEGPYAPQPFTMYFNATVQKLRQIPGVLFMGQLLRQYEATPIAYANEPIDDAVILHTSGTTNGIHKPVPISDRGLNEAAARFLRDGRFAAYEGNAVSAMMLDLSSSYMLADAMQLPFSFGGTVLTFPLGTYNPKYYEAMAHYKANILISSPAILEYLEYIPGQIDLSNISFIFIGGDSVSMDKKRRFNEMLRKRGAKVGITLGYGLTELCGACILSEPEREDTAIGYPLPGVTAKLFDESDGKYYDLSDGARTGVLHLSSASMSSGKIDGNEFFALEEIDGTPFYDTHDLVSVAEDGCITYAGRMNKYFVNNEGIRFDAGLVESAVGAQPGIALCGLAPQYNKSIHDTVPVLYVRVAANAGDALQTVRNALIQVFIRDNEIAKTNLPGQCVIADSLPQTELGKVDVHRIVKGEVNGSRYIVNAVRTGGALKDIVLVPAMPNYPQWSGLPEELANIPDGDIQLVKQFMPNLNIEQMMSQQFGQAGQAGAAPAQSCGAYQEGINMFIRALTNPLTLGHLLCPGSGLEKLATVGCAAIFALGYAQGMAGNGAQPQGNPMQGFGCNQGMPQQGNPMQGLGCSQGMPQQGMPQQGNPMQGFGCNAGMPQQGMPQQGLGCNAGMPQQGNPMQGLGCSAGMPQQGMPQQGMPQQGMPQQGMPQQGMPQQGLGCNAGMPQQGQGAPSQEHGINSPKLAGVLGRFFNASNASEFYEE